LEEKWMRRKWEHLSGGKPDPFELEIEKALNSIRAELGQNNQIRKVLPAAWTELARKTGEDLKEPGVKSVKAAGARPDATAVDLCDVRHAHAQVSGGRTERHAWQLGLAWGLGGGAISATIAVLLTPPASYLFVWWAIIGIALVAAVVLLRRTYRRRP
jgi:Flp pilus assembly protein TadB